MADESKPQVVAVRTGVDIASRQKIPYFVGVSEATTGARGLSLQYVIIPPAAQQCRIFIKATRRPYTSCQDELRQPMGQG